MDDAGVLRLASGASDLLRLPLDLVGEVLDSLGQARPTGAAPPRPQRPVIGRMPEGVPPAALRPEPSLPAPVDWPFAESFPRTCGTGRLDAGAVYWTDFVYDDHGATGIPDVTLEPLALTIPRGTYTYRKGPAAGNGADLFRAAVGLDTTFNVSRAGFLPGEAGAVHVATDGATALTLRSLEPGTTVLLDGAATGTVGAGGAATIAVPKGRHALQF